MHKHYYLHTKNKNMKKFISKSQKLKAFEKILCARKTWSLQIELLGVPICFLCGISMYTLIYMYVCTWMYVNDDLCGFYVCEHLQSHMHTNSRIIAYVFKAGSCTFSLIGTFAHLCVYGDM